MHLSSLTSILSATLSAFNNEAEPESSKTPQYSLTNGQLYYLTFYENQGPAQMCGTKDKGYMNFEPTIPSDDYLLSIPNDNDYYLDVLESAQSGIFQVIIGGTSPGRLSFPPSNNTQNGKFGGHSNPSVDGKPYMFFTSSTPIQHGQYDHCYHLWIADSSGYEHGWTTEQLTYSKK